MWMVGSADKDTEKTGAGGALHGSPFEGSSQLHEALWQSGGGGADGRRAGARRSKLGRCEEAYREAAARQRSTRPALAADSATANNYGRQRVMQITAKTPALF
jgi:hypothetical protein